MPDKNSHSSQALKKVIFSLPQGMPISMSHLKEFDISRQLLHYYVQSGWIRSLGCGYYLRMGDSLSETGAVSSLQENGVKVHIGGKSALALKGFVHYLNIGATKLTLYGHKTGSLPNWLSREFTISLSNRRLFDEPEELQQKYSLSPLNPEEHAPLISEPERALLEMLDLISKNQTVEEAMQIMEGLQSLRTEKMQKLLECCTRIKVKRLFWQLAGKLHLPIQKRIEPTKINFGSKTAYLLRGEKNLVLRHPDA